MLDLDRDERFKRYQLEGLDDYEIEQREYTFIEELSDDNILDIVSYVELNNKSLYQKYLNSDMSDADLYCYYLKEMNIS